jgi:predicted DCC family thiol-disulfide oxidoreductase YuxK
MRSTSAAPSPLPRVPRCGEGRIHPQHFGEHLHVADFTLLYDRECPFCRLEVAWLLRRDRRAGLAAVDISAADFDAGRFGLTRERVHATLHGLRADGTIVEGMDAVRAAWRAVGLGWVMAPTGWPVLRWFADLGYWMFARYRVPLGRMFGRRCDTACGSG